MTCFTVAACPFPRPSSRVTMSPTPTVAPLHMPDILWYQQQMMLVAEGAGILAVVMLLSVHPSAPWNDQSLVRPDWKGAACLLTRPSMVRKERLAKPMSAYTQRFCEGMSMATALGRYHLRMTPCSMLQLGAGLQGQLIVACSLGQ